MNLVEMKQSVDMLYDEWDLGKHLRILKGKFVLIFICLKYLKKLKKWSLKKKMVKLLEYVDMQNGIQRNI